MREHIAARALLLVIFGGLAACGQKGKLYLPETTSEVVTRPAAQSPDAQPAAPPPAPEVTSPEVTSPDVTTETPKKDKSGALPPPK